MERGMIGSYTKGAHIPKPNVNYFSLVSLSLSLYTYTDIHSKRNIIKISNILLLISDLYVS